MEIVDNRAIKLIVRDGERITRVVPKSKIITERHDGLYEVLVHWGMDEVRVLKNLGIKNVPSPIEGRYNWPGIYAPFKHQVATAAFLTMNQRAYCFSEQGTAKTGACAWAADYLMSVGVIKKVLVICPLSIMKTAWQADLFRTAMHRSVEIAHGTKEKRKDIIAQNTEFLIINFDGVKTVEIALQRARYDLIIIDEANCIKNSQSDRWKTINKLIGSETWVWALTGTPASQSPTDAYGLAKMVTPHTVPKFFTAFRDSVQYKVTQFKYANKPSASDTVHKALQPAIRFTKAECLDLPELLYSTREVPMTTQQQKYYKQLKEKMRMEAAGEEITAVNAGVMLNKLLQCASGSIYTDTKEVVEFDCKSRMAELNAVIEESEHKILVFVMFRHTIEIVVRNLTEQGLTVDVIHGGVSANKRAEVIEKFQKSPEPRILVIQPQSAAHGVTLTAANTIVWWGITASYETYAQANARIHRPGQVNHCTVVHLIGSDVEQKLLTALESKCETQVDLLKMYKDVVSA